MKITGPGQPPSPGAEGVANTEGVHENEGVMGAGPAGASPSGSAFAARLSGMADAGAPGVTETTGGVPIQDLAADLEAGKLDARAAVEQVMARVLELQLGHDAPAAVRQQVESALREALESDPLLAAKLRELG